MEQIGNIHGLAQTHMGLGYASRHKGEWERAIGYYEQARETTEQIGDIHGLATTYYNLGLFYNEQGDTEQAAPYAAQAYLLFHRLGATREAEQAGQLLVRMLGSVEAANSYLSQVVDTKDGKGNRET